MRRTLEMLFRHPLQLLALVLFMPVLGMTIVYFAVRRKYESGALLFALHRYEVIGSTGPESDLTSTPAETQATELTGLLQTRSFALTVVKGIDLASTLHLSSSVAANAQQRDDALVKELSEHVVVTAQSYNLFQIAYTNPDARIAQQIVHSIVENYGPQSLILSAAEGKNLLLSYQQQLQTAQAAENAAADAEAKYVQSHPQIGPTNLSSDPGYQQLNAAFVQAQQNVQSIKNTISTIQQSISASSGGTESKDGNTLYQVIDEPQLPDQPVSRSQSLIAGAGVSLAVALLADVVYLVILVRRNRAIYSAYDLQECVTLPIIMQLPTFTASSVAALMQTAGVD